MAAQATVALGEEAAAENGCSLGMTASAGGAFVLLGLLQPQRWLTQLPPIDTSQHTAAIIIPVLNEAGGIVATLQQLRQLQPQPAEIIVVDGGSSDNTVQLARRSGLATRVMRSGRGRAVQMNAGAEAAAADMLCFLHADTQPPKDLVAVMRRELADPQKVLAGFVPSIEVPGRRLWLLSAHNFASSYYAPLLFRPLSYLRGLRALFGDQTLFCRARDFRAVGGFDPRLSIMEDTDLCVRMHMAGPRQQQQQQRRHVAVPGSSSKAGGKRGAVKKQVAGSSSSNGPNGKSSFRGVFWDRKNSRWRAQVGFNNRKIFMGYYGSPGDAARAYDRKVVQLHGALAKTNFPLEDYTADLHAFNTQLQLQHTPPAPGLLPAPAPRPRSCRRNTAAAAAAAGSGAFSTASEGEGGETAAAAAAAAANGAQAVAACMKQWGSGAAAVLDGQSAADAAF
ncbi:hypothetical protein OEZ86_012780 [Tetradesmus obliquus]|nr:hypothetical protein OEZ86_012780 [Tetradesmus obliquus]